MLKFIKNIFEHGHRYTVYHPELCKYATCSCGCEISLEEAALNNIPVYWRELGQIIVWKPEYIAEMKRKHEEDELRRAKRLEV